MNPASSDNQIAETDRDAAQPRRHRLWRCVAGVSVIAVIFFAALLYTQYQKQRRLIERATVVTKPIGPQWFRNLVGEERLQGFEEIRFVEFLEEPTEEHLELLTRHGVVTLTLKASRVSERGIASIGQMDNLQHFGLFECPEVPESLLAELSGLPKLRVLELNQSKITDSSMRQLKSLKNLENLTLRESEFNPRLLTALSASEHLYSLNLSGTSISDAHLAELKPLCGLEGFLFLSGTSVSDRGLESLKSFRKLRSLGLARTRVTDEGLKILAGMTSLEYLDLSDTAVSDTGLRSLETLSNLSEVNLSGTQVTDTGFHELHASLPDCEIQFERDPLNTEPVNAE